MGKARKAIGKILKWALATLVVLALTAVGIVLLAWSFPGAILTSERVSGWVAPLLRIERDPAAPYPNAPFLGIEIKKDGFKRRTVSFRVAPGCYSLASEPKGGTEACLEAAHLTFSFRLHRRTYVKLTALDLLELRVARARYVEPPATPPEPEPATPAGRFRYLRYLDRGFFWGPILVAIDRFEIPSAKLRGEAKITSTDPGHRGKRRSPNLALDVRADTPDFAAGLEGELYHDRNRLVVPKATATYRTKSGGESLRLAGELNAVYRLESGDLDVGFAVNWRNPTPDIDLLRAENGEIRMREDELFARATAKATLAGKTPLGRLPILTVDVAAAMRPPEDDGAHPIDFDFRIEAYEFAGVRATSDLAVTLVPRSAGKELRYRKGALRVAARDFGRTIRLLSRTSWAIPTPFNVFTGPIEFRTEPFVKADGATAIPAKLVTDLKSAEQAFDTETDASLELRDGDLAPRAIRVSAALRKVKLRLPDYDPIAPVPAVARDRRIVRYEKPKAKGEAPVVAPTETKGGIPLFLAIKGAPGSIVLLNRFFEPALTAGVDLATNAEDGALRGSTSVSAPFEIHYLNREFRLDRFALAFRPAIETEARISMERAGYRIFAELNSAGGKTRVSLGSEPPLQENEIVSLLIYGSPMNSISSEQTRSVGSAQAAMSSEALGIFSFFAFASTPIESVAYDPETQTYSAVVRLPGGLVASIGSSWDNDRQLALSKSIGRNWAVSTELIKDPNGVNRGGTLLRWRKSY